MQTPLHFCTTRLSFLQHFSLPVHFSACQQVSLYACNFPYFYRSAWLPAHLWICPYSTSLFLPPGFSACHFLSLPACACISLLPCRRSFLSKRLSWSVYTFLCILVFLSAKYKFTFTLSSNQGMQPSISWYYFFNRKMCITSLKITTQTMTCPSGLEMIPERSSMQRKFEVIFATFSRSGQAMCLIIMA